MSTMHRILGNGYLLVDLIRRFNHYFEKEKEMKLAKYSLAALAAVSMVSHAMAADSLEDAFKKGTISGELRAWYFDRDKHTATAPATSHESLFSTGVRLNYITDSLYGFKLGLTAQSNYAPFATADEKNMFKSNEYGSGAVLSEAYLAYTLGKTTAKIGRQFISTPLVEGSGSRMIRESFEGATIVNTDIPSTTLLAGYVNKFAARTSTFADSTNIGSVGEFTKKFALSTGKGASLDSAMIDDAYTIMISNKSINNLTLTAQYARADDVADKGDINLYHTEANYLLPMNGFKLGFDAMYRKSSTDSALDSNLLEGSYLGGRIGLYELAGFGISAAASRSDKSDDLIAGIGNGPDSTYTGSILTSSQSYARNTTSYQGKVSYDFSKLGIQGLTSYALYAHDNQGLTSANSQTSGDWDIFAFDISYALSGPLKGLTLSLQYENQDNDKLVSGVNTKTKLDEYRFRANYKF